MKTIRAAVFFLFVPCVYLLSFPNISDCPLLPNREPPTSVFDLRPEDIKAIAALGDSVTAGLAAINDPGAQSLANYLKHYNQELIGASIGTNEARYCPDTFFCLSPLHRPRVDRLNAAQTGSSSKDLDEQIDYLLKYIGPKTRLFEEWKIINVYIGYNDISSFCLPGNSVQKSGKNLLNALKRLVDSTDKAFINVLTVEHYNRLISIPSKHLGYIKPFKDGLKIQDYECVCCSQKSVVDMDKYVDSYNHQLKIAIDKTNQYIESRLVDKVLEDVGLKSKKRVAVALQPMDINPGSVPYDSFSNLDGFHPNIKTHMFASKFLWRQMFLSKKEKLSSRDFDQNLPVYCPTAEDRFQI
ncbi:hypothetical protein BY458DRAFT_578115 [Sporodiniella umbellata]|nr:hypothetical protein BY458DRAFT_578115 [Sporodiniella umbellata]